MSVVESLDVQTYDLDRERLLGAAVQTAGANTAGETYTIAIDGWILSRDTPASRVEAVHRGQVIQTAPIRLDRPDVAARFPAIAWAPRCGFLMLIGTLGLDPAFEVELRAVVCDQRLTPFAVIRGRRTAVNSGFEPMLRPLMVTTLGRTGSTWLMRLLAEHPAIVTLRRYPYELRATEYWLRMLRILAGPVQEPNLAAQGGASDLETGRLGGITFDAPYYLDNPLVWHWLGRTYAERLVAFCQQSIDELYRQIAASQGQAEPAYFVEKALPTHDLPLLWQLYPQGRQLFLVRDFRDMVCSILAFNARRGSDGFGRERARSDDDYLLQLRDDILLLIAAWRQRSSVAHLLRYEELVTAPLETLRSILRYAEIDATTATIEGMIERALVETPQFRYHRTSPTAAESIGRWRDDLSPEMQARAHEAFGDLLVEFGYPVNGVAAR